MSDRVRAFLAVFYLLAVMTVFVGLQYADPGWAEGGIPLVVVTLPWSIAALGVAYAVFSHFASEHTFSVAGWAINFFLFVVISAGLNAALIVGISRVRRWFNLRTTIAATVVTALLLVAVQATMERVEEDAHERSRPKGVPKSAVYTGPSAGWWQICSYDSARGTNHCQIWNRVGEVLEDDEFVPYDSGPAVVDKELQIDPKRGNPKMVTLRNGRILVPQSRAKAMRQELDRLRTP